MIRSVNDNQQQILREIMELYKIKEITLDFTYSKGVFYKDCEFGPRVKMDVYPQTTDTIKLGKLQPIPMADGSCECIVYDPPFVISPSDCPSIVDNPREGSMIIQKRFGSFYPLAELITTYRYHMAEMHRLLRDGGYAIVKCQNVVSGGKQINSPEYLWFVGESLGFNMVDKFVLVAKSRLTDGRRQQHSRRFESYFLVFCKSSKRKPNYLTADIAAPLLDGFRRFNLKETA